MPEGITQHQSVEEADEEVELITASARSMNADRRFNQGKRESIETVINVNGRFAEDGKKNSIPEVPSPGRHYDNVYASIKVDGNSRQHFGDNHYYFQPSHRESASDFQDTGRRTGIHFSFEKRLLSNRRNSAQRMRELYVAKKKPTVSSSLDHLGVYTSYVGVKTPKVQQRLKQMASRFQQVDKLFAAMFAHVIESRDHRDLENILLNIRKEISKHQPKGATAGSDTDDTYLGDLGHYFEDLLSNEAAKSAPQRQETTKKLASFRVTSGTGDSLLQYLQDGLEIPYWEIIIDAISASLANETTLGSGMISLQLRMTRKEMRGLRDGLRDVLAEPSSADESIDAILLGIDKRMAVLDNFTDSRVTDLYDPGLDAEPGHSELADSQNPGDEAVLTSYAQQSTKQLVILTAAIILALIGAFVPFVKGFAISWSDNEPGKKTDSDYWYNISSSIAVIMGNLAMVIPLIKGSWLSAPYIVTWMWFGVGLGCAVMSIVIYPLCNPGWSSLLAFCATIAGFGATLSITMAVGKDETSGQTSAGTRQTKGATSRSSMPQHNSPGKSKSE